QVVIGDGGHVVEGDPEQLSPALREIVRFADAMSEAGIPTELVLEEEPATERLRIALHGEALGRWRLPNTFRPFYPSRLLQGHGHGLALFLAQTVMLGHGGQASARRLDDGLEIVFVLGR
ncbi:MAG: hypothetical protein KDE27_19620, partial [Planctomycetes bacterium]|nr:hypothetical protein [Planctomycetota bacterium]